MQGVYLSIDGLARNKDAVVPRVSLRVVPTISFDTVPFRLSPRSEGDNRHSRVGSSRLKVMMFGRILAVRTEVSLLSDKMS